jgi:CRISPR-associated endoribonuclease Cas6
VIIRSIWTLSSPEKANLPRAYALELSRILHQKINITLGSQEVPDTTSSPLLGMMTASDSYLGVSPDQSYRLILSGLNTPSSKAIVDFNLGDSLDLFGTHFEISNRENILESYDSLYTKHVASEPQASTKFLLNFATPTAFAQRDAHLPLPLPMLMFRSWLERWNHFSPVYLGSSDLLGYIEEAVLVAQHRIQTHKFILPRGFIIGFTGNVTLQLRRQVDPLLANVINLLLAYAPYAGTGVKTRLGMGQTEVQALR